ncbi:MAG: hypothetical protein JXR68_07880 [Bacteroidales bacterium]|nr:hypothetical protein [Bacteroidales bacterium]
MKFADLHIHSTLKPFSYFSADPKDVRGSIWYQDLPHKRERDNDLVNFTQADFTTMAQSGMKLIFIALYPMEQGWVNSFDTGVVVDAIVHLYTKFPFARINQIQKESYNYFNELQKEYSFLKKETQNPRSIKINGEDREIQAKFPRSKKEFEQFLEEENTLIIIPTIEGANSLISGNGKNMADFNLEQTLRNIQLIKQWPTPPIFITLAHHFYNGICGHVKSIYPKGKIQEFVQKILIQQAEGIDVGITLKGETVIKSLLEIGEFNNKSKRILIDTKHMNSRARSKFYQIVLQHNEANPDDIIPLIASHSAYSGIKTFAELQKQDALDNKYFAQSDDYFNQAKINLCDQDIKLIYHTQGLIGINIDERILSSKKIIDLADGQFNHKPTNELKMFWAEQIVRNISSMAKVIFEDIHAKEKHNVWNTFAIGSDYDGFINPVDAFITTNDYSELEKYLIISLEKDVIFKQNNFELTAQQVARKIMFENAHDFLQKHYFKFGEINPA